MTAKGCIGSLLDIETSLKATLVLQLLLRLELQSGVHGSSDCLEV